MKKLTFGEEEISEMKINLLKEAYEKYAGVKFPSCLKKWEYDLLLEDAYSDLLVDRRNLDQEIYDSLVEDLISEFQIALFGQWAKSKYGQPQEALRKARSLFLNSEEFYSFLKKRLDCARFRAHIKAIYEGVEYPHMLPFGF